MDPLTIATVGMSAYNALNAGKQQGKADKLSQQALDISKQQYAERSPFRQMALNGINAANAPVNSASIFQNKSNPFSAAHDYTQDLGANRTPQIDVAGSLAQSQQQLGAQNLEQAKNDLRKSGMPVGIQQRIMQGWDRAAASGQPQASPQMPTNLPQAQGANPQAIAQQQFLARYGGAR